MTTTVKRALYSGACALLMFAASATSLRAEEAPLPSKKRFLSKPLTVCDMGSFYIGGVPKVTEYSSSFTPGPPKQVTIGQMYVQFMIPSKPKTWPLILIHGGMYSGASWESTDDGREGWMPYGVRKGYSIYGIDYPGRGRSGFDSSAINEAVGTGNKDVLPRPVSRALSDDDVFGGWSGKEYRFGFFGHLVPFGSNIINGTLIPHGAPGDPDPPAVHGTYQPDVIALNVIDPAIEARKGAIGPAPNPVNNKALALHHYKQLLPLAENTLPAANCEACTPKEVIPQNVWTPLALAQLIEGLGGAVIAGHSGGGLVDLHLVRVMKERGTLHLLKGVIQLEAACNLPGAGLTPQDFDKIPFMALKGDYFDLSLNALAGCTDAIKAMNAGASRTAAPAAFVALDGPAFGDKFNGVSHMMMVGNKSNEVFDVVTDWIDKNVPKPKPVAVCGR